jgi:signal transduction histidine kinase
MIFNLINNIQTCVDIINIYTPSLSVVYYSHILPAIMALFLGSFIFIKNKTLSSKILFLITILFSIWCFFDIILWTSFNSQSYVFFWSLITLIEVLLFIFSLYFINLISSNVGEDVKFKYKFIFLIILTPIILLTATKINISYFDIQECIPVQDKLYGLYVLPLIGLLSLFLIFNFFYLFKRINQVFKKQFILIAGSLFGFLSVFFLSNFIIEKIIENELLLFGDAYKIEMYSLFMFPIFLAILIFVIVRFQAFNIKLLGAQALVWTLIILVGAQFLYTREMPITSIILTAVTFILSIILGVLVIKSVKKLDTQRELLDIANKNQQSLLHFITHQVKGYLTKSRNIFDGLIAGDYGDMPPQALNMIKHGFESDTRGVETVQAILRASDLKSGRVEFKKEKTNVSALVAEVIELRKDQADSKKLELTFEIEPNIELIVDSVQLKEVFKNLVTNSILYTITGAVHVVFKREGNKVRFSVVDTGVGLSPEDKAKLFTEGGKGPESLNVNIDSTGYGLFIAKNIVHKHHGTIGAISEGRGKGSEFFVVLPDMS